MLKTTLENDGYVFLKEFMPDCSTQELIKHLEEYERLESISKVHLLTPKKKVESKPNTYSGMYGYGEFPMHTDLAHWPAPPRYILLRCVKGNSRVSTKLIDGKIVIDAIGQRLLERSLVKPRRPHKGKFNLMRLFQTGSTDLLRWDTKFIVPASPAGLLGVTAMKEKLESISSNNIILEKMFDTLLIDNWRMLHGRTSLPNIDEHREVERVYLGEKV